MTDGRHHGRHGRTQGRPLAALCSAPAVLAVLAALVAGVALLDAGGLLSAAATVTLAATAAAGAALAVCAAVAACCVPAVPPTRVRTAIRDRSLRTAFLPQRDPDAPGRRRPRAPGRALPATAAQGSVLSYLP